MILSGAWGERLGAEGHRGFFEVDVLLDTDTGDVYLGELNPRISGASSITNVTAGAYADIPLFCFHLLEYFDVDFELDIEEINARWRELAAVDQWSQMVIKETSSMVQLITSAAPTGQYSYDQSGALVYRRAALDWHQLQNESEAFFLRIYGAGDYRWKGADLGGCRDQRTLTATIGRCRYAHHPCQAPHRFNSQSVVWAASGRCRRQSSPRCEVSDARGAVERQAVRSRISWTSSMVVCGCRNAKRPTVSPSHFVGGMKAISSSCKACAHLS